ncbi:MAG: hypothetical protein ACK559_27690, partial [bacterium]
LVPHLAAVLHGRHHGGTLEVARLHQHARRRREHGLRRVGAADGVACRGELREAQLGHALELRRRHADRAHAVGVVGEADRLERVRRRGAAEVHLESVGPDLDDRTVAQLHPDSRGGQRAVDDGAR